MGKVYPFSDDLLRILRRELRKYGATLVKNKKTGAIFLRALPDPKPQTERQKNNSQNFGNLSHQASEWIKNNGPKACPPDGTPEYQRILRSFKRQKIEKRLHNFVMSKIQDNLLKDK